jgi:hypothetical protein
VNSTGTCSLGGCADPAVTYFARQDLCIRHFLSCCYEDLDRFDVRSRRSEVDRCGPARLKAFVEECSRCALEVSLRCEHLDNLQRARLLDILLWAGELLPKASVVVVSTRDPFSTQETRGSFSNEEAGGSNPLNLTRSCGD